MPTRATMTSLPSFSRSWFGIMSWRLLASLRLSIPMLRELAKHNFPRRCLPILVTGFFNALDRFGCGITLDNPIGGAKRGRPSETSRTVDENLGIRRNGLDDLPEASQLIQRHYRHRLGSPIAIFFIRCGQSRSICFDHRRLKMRLRSEERRVGKECRYRWE